MPGPAPATWAAPNGARVGALLVDGLLGLVLYGTAAMVVPSGRPLATDFLTIALVATYQTGCLASMGSTLGKLAAGLEVRVVGSSGPVPWPAAFRRSIITATCYCLALPGTPIAIVLTASLAVSTMLSRNHRGFHDRMAGTVVVRKEAPQLISTEALDEWFDLEHQPVLTRWGRAVDLTERRRIRAARLEGSPWLLGVLVVAAVASTTISHSLGGLALAALVFLGAFVVDETARVARTGTTPGHEQAGFRIVDVDTGEPPSTGRSLARALVLGPLLYVPPLQMLLAVWVRASATNRGPHDLAGHTIVVEPGYEPKAPPQAVVPQYWQPAWPTGYGWPAQSASHAAPGWGGGWPHPGAPPPPPWSAAPAPMPWAPPPPSWPQQAPAPWSQPAPPPWSGAKPATRWAPPPPPAPASSPAGPDTTPPASSPPSTTDPEAERS